VAAARRAAERAGRDGGDGHGRGAILRYVGRTDLERRVALNIIGPHWEGNQVWFVLGGGAVFAAFR
jgi:Cytochrome bd-type quinol oxidase, subunit 2